MSARHYYNEIDPYCAAWLRNLMDAGHIPAGDIDTRSIEDVRPNELAGYVQCHFFAGIAGWPLALALAGWPVDRPVWTGSCPCQPFSEAGLGHGFADQRHLWPAFYHHIRECMPPAIFGEQVASKAGRQWLDRVSTDLEAVAYAACAADLCAASVRAPHRRQRLFWVADLHGQRLAWRKESNQPAQQSEQQAPRRSDAGGCGAAGWLVDAPSEQVGESRQPWEHWDVVDCGDGRRRRFEPSAFPVAHGVPGRVGRLRAYGNAIVPQAAAEFIRAYAEARGLSLGDVREAA